MKRINELQRKLGEKKVVDITGEINGLLWNLIYHDNNLLYNLFIRVLEEYLLINSGKIREATEH